ncbi:MAG: ATP-grasp domain-containing protein [Chloroflexota bacterium]
MARLHEYQGKAILRQFGIRTPKGGVASTPDEAHALAAEIGAPVVAPGTMPLVIKAQAWTTSRAGQKLIQFAENAEGAAEIARDLLGRQVGNFRVEQVMVEEVIPIAREFYLGVIIDDAARAPLVIFSSRGGSGFEEIAQTHPEAVARHAVDIRVGLREFEARELTRQTGIEGKLLTQLGSLLPKFYAAARAYEARSAEINPLALTESGDLIALDARFTVDDYAVYRHPDLGIDIAREFDRPPSELEKIAWAVEKHDYRGTFYFIQMERDFRKGERVIGFHGAGGGGSMMNMDALFARGFKVADFVDTSGNPPASKVYRAARIILSQRGIDGYYAGGSGVASQEQFNTARGLVKAFIDDQLNVPAVIRVGGNLEAEAIAILQRANGAFPAPVEAYGRDATPDACVERLEALVDAYIPTFEIPVREIFNPVEPYSFDTVTGGTITYDHALCRDCESKACVTTCVPQILSLENGVPVLNISREDAKRGGCVECLACEVECYFLGNRGGRIFLPIEGLNRYRDEHGDSD